MAGHQIHAGVARPAAGRPTRLHALGAVVALMSAVALAGCGPKSLQELVDKPEVGYRAVCGRNAAEHKKQVDELRYFPPKLMVRAWPKPVAGDKEATFEDAELVDRLVKGEARRVLLTARGGVGKSTLATAMEAMACGRIPTMRIDLNRDVAARLAANKGGNEVLAAMERAIGVASDVGRRESFRQLAATAPMLLLADSIEEVPLADRPTVIQQLSALATQQPELRVVLLARPAVFDADYGLANLDGRLEIATLDCGQSKSVLRWSAPDREHQARAENFIRTYRLDQQTTRNDRCIYPYMTAYRDLEVVARMAEKFEPQGAEGGLTASLSVVHETIVGERLLKEIAALEWSQGAVLAAIDRMVQVDGRTDGSWNLVFNTARCMQAVAPDAKGETAARYVCEKILQSALFDRIVGVEEWRFDHQNVSDLFLARWLDREITRFQGDCEVVDKHASWIGERDIAGYLVGQPAGRRCLPQVAASICAAHKETFERGLGDLLYKGLPTGKERGTLVEAARTAVGRWKKASPCVKSLVETL